MPFTISVKCKKPSIDLATFTEEPPFFYEDSIQVTCKAGHELCDGTSFYTSTCLVNGEWSRTDPCIGKPFIILPRVENHSSPL